jgi:hypothetical protein
MKMFELNDADYEGNIKKNWTENVMKQGSYTNPDFIIPASKREAIAKHLSKLNAPRIAFQNKMKTPEGRTALLLRDAKLIADYQIKNGFIAHQI